MTSPRFSRELFLRLPIVGILRGFTPEQVRQAVVAACEGGVCNFEVTMNTPRFDELIPLMRNIVGSRANVGAGTVCSLADLERALGVGAGFIVTPTLNPEVIVGCVQRGLPVFPGALSATEVARAFELGADAVKIFPSEVLGPAYIQGLKSICPDWRLMPTGGVTLATIAEYKRAGAEAFGIGGPLFDQARVTAGDWEWIKDQAHQFANACASV